MKIKDIVKICNGKLICGNLDDEVFSFSKDTRDINKNDMYIGIKGENYNGNEYYLEAFNKGAMGAIIDDEKVIKDKYKSIILVNNSVKALHELAKYQISKHNIPVIAITGSVGKTSTKDIISKVLERKYKVLKTKGNYNGQIGLPFTIFDLKDEEIIVLEMGMNDFGQLKKLSLIAKPNIAVITNIGTSHIGILGSKEKILIAKLEILEGLKDNGILIYNNDDELLKNVKYNIENIINFGFKNISDCYASDIVIENDIIKFTVKYKNINELFTIPNLGEVYIYNAMVAIIIGIFFNVEINDIKVALNDFELSKNRMEIIKTKNNITFINDYYNASYESIKNSLSILKQKDGRKIAIIGDMLELGEYNKELHERVAKEILKTNIDIVITIGKNAMVISDYIKTKNTIIDVYSYNELSDFYTCIDKLFKSDDTILLKASNGMKFNNLFEKIKEYYF